MRISAILTGPSTHLDHLGILSAQLQIPLIVTEEKTYALGKNYYPDFDIHHVEMSELTFEFLAHHFDMILESGKFWAAEMGPFIELLFQKKIRFAFCPHGNSDKGHSLNEHPEQDISLVYGDHLLHLLQRTKAAEKIQHIVRTGNYRYAYYLRHRSFYDNLLSSLVPNTAPAILYAPTWHGSESPTSFFTAIDTLIQELTPAYQIIVKLHPFLSEDHPAQVYTIMSRYENHPRVHFLTEFPPIYPLLARCAAYIGDYSSIGYDFLAFDKPLYFFNPKRIDSPLQKCGLEIPNEALNNLQNYISRTYEESQVEFQKQRIKTYLYAFGEEVPPQNIKNQLFEIFNKNEIANC